MVGCFRYLRRSHRVLAGGWLRHDPFYCEVLVMPMQLDPSAQKRLAARIAARRGGRFRVNNTALLVRAFAADGWTAEMIGEHFGRSAHWASEKMREYREST